MSKVVLIDPVQDPRWDKFVEAHPYGWVTHLSGWKQVLENTFKHINGYYYALIDENSDKICAGLPVFHVKSRLTGNRLVSAPFASLFDPIVNDDNALEALIASIKKLSKDLNCSSYEMRTLLSPSFSNDIHLKCVNGFTHHFLSLKPSLPEIKQSFHRKTVRQSVNRSLKCNLSFCSDRNQKDFIAFYNLYFKTRKRLGLPAMPVIFFENLFNYVGPKYIDLYFVKKDKKAIAALMCLKFKQRISAEAMGWDRRYCRLCPNHFLYWSIIQEAKNEGYEIFDFGRTATTNQNVMKFKDRWGTEHLDMAYYIFPDNGVNSLQHENSRTYKLTRKILRSSPDNLYRILGNHIYNHLG